jgi:hypothetical protein
VPPSDLTPPPPTPSSAVKQDSKERPGETVFDVFGEWNSIPDQLSLYSRVLISEIAVSFAQSGSQETVEKYAADLKSEVRRALSDRAKQIVDKYTSEVTSSLGENAAETTWIDAVKWGIANHLDDFKISQNDSFRDLAEFVRSRTSFHAQAVVAFAAALFLAVFVGVARYAVTIFDDIHPHTTSSPVTHARGK